MVSVSPSRLHWVPCLGSPKLSSRSGPDSVLLGAPDPLPVSCSCWQNSVPYGCATEILRPLLAVGQGCSQLLGALWFCAMWPLTRGSWLLRGQEETLSLQRAKRGSYIIYPLTSHHRIPLAGSKSQVPPALRMRGLCRA